MPDSTGSLIESQVDWLTCSAHGTDAAANLLAYAVQLAADQEIAGNRRRPFRLMGYEGEHVGAVEYGQRDEQSTILRLIGDAADTYLTAALSIADSVTRVDLAATWHATPADPMIGANAYTMAHLWWQQNERRAKPTRILDPAGGGTTYVGSRESANFLRVYDKYAECVHNDDAPGADRYRDCWRFELEVKGELAHMLANRTDQEQDRPAYVQRYLAQWCDAHGIVPPFPDAGHQALIPGFRRRSDADSKLRHLAKNVRPTVRWLRDSGHDDDLREALEIDRTAGLLRELEGILARHAPTLGRPTPQDGD